MSHGWLHNFPAVEGEETQRTIEESSWWWEKARYYASDLWRILAVEHHHQHRVKEHKACAVEPHSQASF